MSLRVHDPVAMDNFRQVGLFHASAIARVLNGAKPRDLPMVFPEQAHLAINLVTAHAVGFIPPAHLLAGADLLFHDDKQLP